MKCFFLGHKFDKIQPDGFQYCVKCGFANKPHQCTNGHSWIDDDVRVYKNTNSDPYGGHDMYISRQIFQICTKCGERRTIWQR